jgi:hypothetical protein
MNGLLLAKNFYFDCVRPIIAAEMPALTDAHAAGLVGYGSDVMGNDDELSRDHEWGPRLVLFLRESDYPHLANKLDRVLNESLPLTFAGFPTRFKPDEEFWGSLVMSACGDGSHHIAITTPQTFLKLTIGHNGLPDDDFQWLSIPEQRLLEFTRGEIFSDGVGEITGLRERLSYFPTDVWKYRLAYAFESLGWELDLIPLCAKRGDPLSVHLNAAATVARIVKLTFLLNRKYCPGYAKWLHREFKKLPIAAGEIDGLLTGVFATRDTDSIVANIGRSLTLVYAQFRNLHGLPDLPCDLPGRLSRGTTMPDTQAIARIIQDSIEGPLLQLKINGAPYGAVDQWITQEDILLSPDHMKALLQIYSAQAARRTRLDEMI